jgi:hypothetical protein
MLIGSLPNHAYKGEITVASRLAPRQVEFNRIFLESVDEGLSCLGEIPKQLLYSQLEKMFSLNKNELQFRLDDFSGALEEIFGAGANFIEIQIMKNLHSKTRCNFEWRELTNFKFSRYVSLIKLSFMLGEKEKKPNSAQEINQKLETAWSTENCPQTTHRQN